MPDEAPGVTEDQLATDGNNGEPPEDLLDDVRYTPRVTLREIAAHAGVHPATVSRALSDEKSAMVSDATRARVVRKAAELGYEPSIPARTLRQGRSQTMGVIVADLGNPYTGQIVRGIENALEGRGIMALIAETQDDIDRMGRVLNHLFSRSVDAIITTAARNGTEAVLNKAYRRVPVVLADRSLPGSDLRTVAPDDVLGARLVAAHLVELGHRRIALLRGPSGVSSFERRTDGFREAIEAAGAELVDLDDEAADPSIQEGRRLAGHILLLEERPTALFAENDLMAVGALDRLSHSGVRCPEDMSIVGYDDLQLTEFTSPPLTTVRLPGYQLGRFAAEMAVSLSEDETIEVTDLTLSPSLVVRGSSAPVGGYPPED
ncbi:MAG TPA: LacI family DNA-binding transcriptional regulator [Acidimicrobiia bacterium]